MTSTISQQFCTCWPSKRVEAQRRPFFMPGGNMDKLLMDAVQVNFDLEKEVLTFRREDYDGDISFSIPYAQLKATYKMAKKEMENKAK